MSRDQVAPLATTLLRQGEVASRYRDQLPFAIDTF